MSDHEELIERARSASSTLHKGNYWVEGDILDEIINALEQSERKAGEARREACDLAHQFRALWDEYNSIECSVEDNSTFDDIMNDLDSDSQRVLRIEKEQA